MSFPLLFGPLPRNVKAPLVGALAALSLAVTACSTAPTASLTSPEAATLQTAVDPVGLFPMGAYDQNVDHWIDPARADYDTPFLSPNDQRAHLDALYARYFGHGAKDASPWNPAFINSRLYGQGGSDIVDLQLRRIGRYDNAGKAPRAIGYGQDYRPHTQEWIDAIEANMNLQQFAQAPRYAPSARAIATENLLVRELPTMDPSFYSHRIAGEGYPFDNLQISAVRPGTPLYVLGQSDDGAWDYVQTPDVQGWVQAAGVAFVDDAFVETWTKAARAGWGAVVAASASVRDTNGLFRFAAPVGTLLPLVGNTAGGRTALVPVRDANAHARIRTATLPATQIAAVPLAATPRHLAMLMKALIGRPYGWGNMLFYNDCSSELQSIFAAFGVWLPRHSSAQMAAGEMTDLSALAPGERLATLMREGKPMRTLVYIGGHVMLYLGTTRFDGHDAPLVYQDIWGLRPANNSRRAIIGGSVVLPLLLRIPEDPSLQSLAATPIFQISILGAPSGAAPAPDEENPAG